MRHALHGCSFGAIIILNLFSKIFLSSEFRRQRSFQIQSRSVYLFCFLDFYAIYMFCWIFCFLVVIGYIWFSSSRSCAYLGDVTNPVNICIPRAHLSQCFSIFGAQKSISGQTWERSRNTVGNFKRIVSNFCNFAKNIRFFLGPASGTFSERRAHARIRTWSTRVIDQHNFLWGVSKNYDLWALQVCPLLHT
jgi:hypothetical protein